MRSSGLGLGPALPHLALVFGLAGGIGGCTDSHRQDAVPPATLVVAVDGSDTGTGTRADPLGTINEALQRVKPGQQIWITGGKYVENVRNPTVAAATGTLHRTSDFPGEDVEFSGLFWLTEPSYWQVSGIRFSWDDRNVGTEHMVKMTGGSNWSFTGNELAGRQVLRGTAGGRRREVMAGQRQLHP